MEEVKLTNKEKKSFDTTENKTWIFYYGSGLAKDADKLKKELDKKGLYSEVDLHRIYGWFVRVKKDGKTKIQERKS